VTAQNSESFPTDNVSVNN